MYYLESRLARKTTISGDISVSLIDIYLTLSLWCSPPRKWGSYKHQMSLMTALNICLCLDLGNDQNRSKSAVLKDSSPERHALRAFMGVYSCCGSLGLSLPRFKVVNWSSVHQRCSNLLLMGESTDHDRFLCYYSRLVGLGEEIFGLLSTNDTRLEDPNSLKTTMVSYERKMQSLAVESGLFKEQSLQHNMLSVIYYQLLMTMYDYVVCKVLLRKDFVADVYIQTLMRLVKASEKVIQSFISLCGQTIDFPTFFYYRPMHALVALIRARLLARTQSLGIDIDVESEFEKVSKALKELSEKSKVAAKMAVILTRISRWMKVSSKFNRDGATNSMVDLLDELGREKAVENIKVTVRKKEGDNDELRGESKIKFKRFINYTGGDLKRRRSGERVNEGLVEYADERTAGRTSDGRSVERDDERGEVRTEAQVNNDEHTDDRTPQSQRSTSIPSPIGFNPSEFAEIQLPDVAQASVMNLTESEVGFQEQQSMLNDIFSQIDSDLMDFQLQEGFGRGSFSAEEYW
ncbi:DEKNAAC103913 [Brettanomyces naardenensis]|uniref:DEKNAAC103913 n=1 Tax=Brettanomyces naardenensis TaxID=13370 RepID=A0A448YPG6_BRENA|nr:DEKNAAC103913 [Brettanomyces naardenensis]